MPTRTDDRVRCSFCGKTQDQVRKLIAGSKNVFICDECIELCGEILAEELEEEEEKEPVSPLAGINLLKPKEIKGMNILLLMKNCWNILVSAKEIVTIFCVCILKKF